MRKHCSSVLMSLWILLLTQGFGGCFFRTPIIKSKVTITLENGHSKTLYFEVLDLNGDEAKPFREFLEKLQRGDREAIANINKPLNPVFYVSSPDRGGYTPLEIAIEYGLGKLYHGGDKDFHAARFLLEKGADPNTAIHTLCSQLSSHEEDGQRALVLLLSYGASLDDPQGETMCTAYLEDREPWIPQWLRWKHYDEKERSLPRPREKPTDPDGIAAEEAAEALRCAAWRTAIPSDEQKARKTKYFTYIAQELLKPENNRGKPLDASFVSYLEEKTQVNSKLVNQLNSRTS